MPITEAEFAHTVVFHSNSPRKAAFGRLSSRENSGINTYLDKSPSNLGYVDDVALLNAYLGKLRVFLNRLNGIAAMLGMPLHLGIVKCSSA